LNTPNLNQVLVYQAIGLIKALLLGGATYAKAFVEAEGIPNMTELITFDSDHVKYEACRVIAALFREGWFVKEVLQSKSLPALSIILNSKFDVLKQEGATAIIKLLKDASLASTILEVDGLLTGLESVFKTFITQEPKLTLTTTATAASTATTVSEPERISVETVKFALTALKLLLSSSSTSSANTVKNTLLDLQNLVSDDTLNLVNEVLAFL